MIFFFCVGVMYLGEYDVTLSVYPHQASLKNMPRHIFQACLVWIYTQSNITNIVVINVFHVSLGGGGV